MRHGRTGPRRQRTRRLRPARGSARPGIVFARAAARNEVDPLADPDARILCGLPVR